MTAVQKGRCAFLHRTKRGEREGWFFRGQVVRCAAIVNAELLGLFHARPCFSQPHVFFPGIGHIFIGCFAWRELHGSSWYHACYEIITQKTHRKNHLPERFMGSSPLAALGVATSISCILSFCGGTSCADFRFDFDAF